MALRLGQRIQNEKGRFGRIGGFLEQADGKVWGVTSRLPFYEGPELFDVVCGERVGMLPSSGPFVGERSIVEAIGVFQILGPRPDLSSRGPYDRPPTGLASPKALLGCALYKFGSGATAKVSAVHSIVPVTDRATGGTAFCADAVELTLDEPGAIANDDAGTLYLNEAAEAVGVLIAANSVHAYLAPLELFVEKNRGALLLPRNDGAGLDVRLKSARAALEEEAALYYGPVPRQRKVA